MYVPRQRPDLAINKFVTLMLQDKPIQMFGDVSTKRDYTDIVSGIVFAIFYDKTNYEIINLGGGESVSLRDMIKVVEKALDRQAVIECLPM